MPQAVQSSVQPVLTRTTVEKENKPKRLQQAKMTLHLWDYSLDLPADHSSAPWSQIHDVPKVPYMFWILTRQRAQVGTNTSADHHQTAESVCKDLASSATASCLQQRTRTTAGERQNPPDHEEYLCKQALYSDEVALNNLFPGNGDQGPEAWAEEFYCCGLGSAAGFLMKWRASNHLHICWDTTALHWQAKFLPCIGDNFFIQMVRLLASSNAA